MSGAATSLFEITRSLGADDARLIKQLPENGARIPPRPRLPEAVGWSMKRREIDGNCAVEA